MAENHEDGEQFHRRKRSLTEADINDILAAFEKRPHTNHLCRFEKISEDDFYASVEFFKSFNESLKAGKAVAAKTVLVLLITFLAGVIGAGFLSKLKGP